MIRSLALALALSLAPLTPCALPGSVGSGSSASAQEPAATPTPTPTTIDINTATLEQLDALPGIGPSKAAAIIEARTRRPFRRLSDLLRVPGIGRSTLERLAPYLRCDPPPSAPRVR